MKEVRVISRTLLFTVVLVIAPVGCTSVPRDAGFSEVQKTVADRTGQKIHWNQGTTADREVADAIAKALQRELTPDDAVTIALLNNQDLQATYEELGIAQAELVDAGLLTNPTLSAEVRFPRRPKLPFEVDVTQSFMDLLTLQVRQRLAGAAFEAAKHRVTNEVLNTAAQVEAAYYRAQGAAQLLEVRRAIVGAAEASFEAAKQLHDAGNITDLALAGERSLLEQSNIDLAKAKRDALDAREELNGLMGLWGPDTGWTVSPRLPELPATEIALNDLESQAVGRRDDLSAARQEVEQNAQALGLSEFAAWGDASIGAHLEKDTDGALTVGPAVQIPLPIFNQGQGVIAAAQARLRQSQHRYAALTVQVRAHVRRDCNQMAAAQDLANHYNRVVLPLRHQIVQQTQLQFNAMQVGVFELLQAKQAEIDAGRDYVEALQDYWVARAELERDVGGRLPEANPTTHPSTTTASDIGNTSAPGQQQHHHDGE
jgi:cobalt-zinc-cadmium efflux system outer membrane protein